MLRKEIILIIALITILILILMTIPRSNSYIHLFKYRPKVPIVIGTEFEKNNRTFLGKLGLAKIGEVEYVPLDSAASTFPFKNVCQKIDKFMPYYSNIHRGHGYLSKLSSNLFDKSRELILNFLNAPKELYSCVFGKNTSECINKLAHCFTSKKCKCKTRNVILISEMEHHSNILPWLEPENGKIVEYIKTHNKDGSLDMDDYAYKIKKHGTNIAIVSISGASNVTGITTDIKRIVTLAKQIGAYVSIDGAQLVPHRKVDMTELGIDFLCFSAHKMYSPFGIGVMVGLKEFLNQQDPCFKGGGEVIFVDLSTNKVVWKNSEEKHEEGTQNIVGVIALSESIKILSSIGMDNVHSHETELYRYAYNSISKIPNINILSPSPEKDPIGVFSFFIGGLHQGKIGSILEYEYGIGLRSGCLCASSYVRRLLGVPYSFVNHVMDKIVNEDDYRNISGVVRISFGLYTTKDDIDRVCIALKNIIRGSFKNYIQKKNGEFVLEKEDPRLTDYDITI